MDEVEAVSRGTVDESTVTPRRSRIPAVIRALRPKQWVKNVLVFAAPLASGRLLEWPILRGALLSLLAFILVSAFVYLVNDTRDLAEDRQHPTKRFRPIAAGEVSIPVALVLAAVCLAASLAVAFATSVALGVVVVVYATLQLTYSVWFKHRPVVDLALVALGFLLRALAGGVASAIPLSQWFLLVASFGSLFMVAGKRYSELVQLGSSAGTRPSLASYSPDYLRFVWAASATLVITFYGLWAFDQRGQGLWTAPWPAISIAPFTLAILSYARDIDRGEAGEPENVVLHDPMLLALGVVWLVSVSLAVLS
ncbi:MAG: decaprenyl-phosphate phosphoribosyltransferase [Actinobacteria bacterium]|nr:decaprenyl-phosphate phosphoribosyltransferase [Actinomycetota bacterium]